MYSSPHHTNFRRAVIAGWDLLSWMVGVAFVMLARYDFELNDEQSIAAGIYLAVVMAAMLGLGVVSKLYRGRYKIATFEEFFALGVVAVAAGAVAYAVALVASTGLPRGIGGLAPPVAFGMMIGGRAVYRTIRLGANGGAVAGGKPVLIYGAGDAGHQLLRVIRTDSSSAYKVVGFIDDNPAKRNLRLMNVPVVGTRKDIATAASELGARAVIMAISNVSGARVGKVQDEVEEAGLEFYAVPQLSRLIGGRVQLGDVKRVEISDVLGRRQVETDLSSIASYLSGKRVLITGAGGSIGSELARQVHKFGPDELILLDRDESALHAVQLSIYGQALLDTPDMVLCDIRDEDALAAAFERHRPEIVFHAAALKHLPMLEQYPDEGWKTNVLGTLNLLRLAARYEVTHFVNVSTDKAAEPSSVLGRTKRIAEQLTASIVQDAPGNFMSVRFGNVLGSRGSMLHTFNAQIDAGGPLTVTHPEVTRYFMTIPEACELVIQAGAIGSQGSVLVLDMGQPVKILDVAKRMIAKSGKAVEIVFTGLRPGEKMHEVLLADSERGAETQHPLITEVTVPPVRPEDLAGLQEMSMHE